MRRISTLTAAVVITASAWLSTAVNDPASAATTGTVGLNSTLQLISVRGSVCPPGMGASVECHARTGAGVVAGLGTIAETYTYLAGGAPWCAETVKIFGYPVRWTVADKGEIHFAVAEVAECLTPAAGLTPIQTFTITGGTGIYTGASGSGRIERVLSFTDTGARGNETWIGTLSVPGVTFDTTKPAITGTTSRTVRAPKRAARVRVTYQVTATDDVDGSVPALCRPRSGTRFKVGRTAVTCTATDRSGNTATARFTVTVRRR